MKSLTNVLLFTALMGSTLATSQARAAVFASAGSAKAEILLYRVNADGYETKLKGGWIQKLFGDYVKFEVTPSGNSYMTPGKGPKGGQRIVIPGMSYSYKEGDYGYTEDWNFSATLSAEDLKTVIVTACGRHCLKVNADITEIVNALEAKKEGTYDVASRYHAFDGDTIGWSDTDGLTSSITLDAGSGNQLKVVLKFPKNWHLEDAESD